MLVAASPGRPRNVDTEDVSAAAVQVRHYDLAVEVQPRARQLRARAGLRVVAPAEGLATLRVYLHRELVVERAAVDSQSAVVAVRERAPDAPGYSPTAVAVDIELGATLPPGQTARVELTYAGPISSTVNGVNLISERLTELASYSSWYPLVRGAASFTYDLSVVLPAGQACVSDGELIERRTEGDKVVCHFRRERPGIDVPLIASNALKMRRVEAPGFQAEVHYSGLPDTTVEDLARVAVEGYGHMVGRFGASTGAQRLVVVLSPRDGWGYSRVPLSVIPEAYALEALGKENGRFVVMHGNLHEVGHFWWQLADSSTPDDWINESLAEFTALDACERLFGVAPAAAVRQAYEKEVQALRQPRPIVETTRGDPDAYVLYYRKGALVWEMLRQQLGDQPLFGVLRRLHATYRGTRELTTQALVEAFAKETDGRTDAFFQEWLRSSALPSVSVEWTANGTSATGRVILDRTSLARHPLDLTFTREADGRAETRQVLVSFGVTPFAFALPFAPDGLAIDAEHRLLKRAATVTRLGE